MRLNMKGRLAVDIMIDLAILGRGGPVALHVLGKRNGVSKSLTEKIIGKLAHGRIVGGVRGPGGGYVLGRDPGRISVADIVIAVDDEAAEDALKVACLGSAGAALEAEWWDRLAARALTLLQTVSLQSLVEQRLSSALAGNFVPYCLPPLVDETTVESSSDQAGMP